LCFIKLAGSGKAEAGLHEEHQKRQRQNICANDEIIQTGLYAAPALSLPADYLVHTGLPSFWSSSRYPYIGIAIYVPK
jgi:hypothetical protein